MSEAPSHDDPQPSSINDTRRSTLGHTDVDNDSPNEDEELLLLQELGAPSLRDHTGAGTAIGRSVDEPALAPAAREYHEDEEQTDEEEEEEQEQEQEQDKVYTGASLYYDATTMASLNPRALAAINRFRSYKPPPFALWDTLPVRKRAAVLVLLFADRWGDLRVVVTMRAATLRNFSGHAALPGGKADNEHETPYQIARREAFEEIGLPVDDSRIPKPFRIEQLCCLPPAMARTHVVVTPCVAFLHADRARGNSASGGNHKRKGTRRDRGADPAVDDDDDDDARDPAPLVEDSLIPRLDAREVAAVFSAPFYNFLKKEDLPARPGEMHPPGRWYEGTWISWEGVRWRTHNFYVPVTNQRVSKPRVGRAGGMEQQQQQQQLEAAVEKLEEAAGQKKKKEEDEASAAELDGGRFRVWGMTGRVLLDAARIAYGEEPEVEHCEGLGDGEIIKRVVARGVFDEVGEPKDAKI